MPYCINCGTKLDEDAKFCKNCGKAVFRDTDVAQDKRNNSEREAVYEGTIHKCPNCGATVDAYEIICSNCGYEIRERQVTSVVHELSLKLENTDNPKKREDLIRTFYIPNTKEDIYEFFILALSNIKIGGMNTDAWMVKLEQAYQKAELSFGNSEEFARLQPMYEEAQKLNKKNSTISMMKNSSKAFKSGYVWALIFCVIGIIFFIVYSFIEIEMIGTIGLLCVVAAAWIGLMTMQNNEDEKNK